MFQSCERDLHRQEQLTACGLEGEVYAKPAPSSAAKLQLAMNFLNAYAVVKFLGKQYIDHLRLQSRQGQEEMALMYHICADMLE